MKSLSLAQPHMIIMVGVPGSGKTFFAEKFAATFHAPYLSLEKIDPFAKNDAAAVTIMQYQLEELLKTRQTILVEGLTDVRANRDRLARQARAAGYQTLFVWVQTDPITAKNRTVKDTKNKTNRTMTSDEYDQTVKHFTFPNATEKPIVISGKHTYATQAKIILKKLSAPRANITTHDTAPIRESQPRRNNITVR